MYSDYQVAVHWPVEPWGEVVQPWSLLTGDPLYEIDSQNGTQVNGHGHGNFDTWSPYYEQPVWENELPPDLPLDADGSPNQDSMVPLGVSGTVVAPDGVVLRTGRGNPWKKLPNGTRARARAMSGQHVLVEHDGLAGWVEMASFRFAPSLVPRVWHVQASGGRCDWRFMSWNCLADGLAQQQFSDRPELDWSVRHHQLLEEVDRVKADVLGLCEINHIEAWKQAFEARGYQCGAYITKPESPCVLYDAPPDGCAVFVSGRFEMLEDLSFAFPHSNCVCAAMRLRDRVLQVESVVAMVHLKSGGREQDFVRTKQVHHLLARARKWIASRPFHTPIIVAGDFNEPPGFGVTQELFKDAFVDLYGGVPREFTAMDYTWGFEGVLDFIFGKNLIPQRALGVASREDIGPMGVPCERYPSDHFAMAVDVAYGPALLAS